jgi:O-Antigen ligase
MPKSLFAPSFHRYVYIFGIALIAVGLPLSKFLMSVGQIILAVNYLLEGNLKQKWSNLLQNKIVLLLISVFALHLFGLLYTSDFDYAQNDIKIKLPLFALPIILGTSEALSKKEFSIILHVFIASIIISTAISALIYVDVIHRTIIDIRDISIFISHIRLALLVCVSIYTCFFLWKESKHKSVKTIYLLTLAWLLYFLILLQSFTGFIALLLSAFVLIAVFLFRTQSVKTIFIFIIASLTISVSTILYLVNVYHKLFPDIPALQNLNTSAKSKLGNTYQFDTSITQVENGNLIWAYYNDEELKTSWNRRSKLDYNGMDAKGNTLRHTLIRFLASKNWRKDAEAIEKLSFTEIQSIENGCANFLMQDKKKLKTRLYEILWEINMYSKNGDANGHSLTQRFEYWRTGFEIFKSNLWLGVGTGDVDLAYQKKYTELNSTLQPEWRLRAHNQYLTFAIAFGLVGLLWFLFSLIYPLIKLQHLHFLYLIFFTIAIVSFVNEDTLETQAGVTFYAFFNSLLLLAINRKSPKKGFF